MSGAVVIDGRGLHAGEAARVTLRVCAGETTLNGAPVSAWRAVKAERSTAIEHAVHGESVRARTVEHLFAALAARGARRGVAIELAGVEPPILDGCAARWMEALDALAIEAAPPAIAVMRDEEIAVETSVYRFARGEGTRVEAEVELGDARIAREASWDGDAGDFRRRIAPARTFCFAHEVEELAKRGLASHVAPEMVVVIGAEILCAGAPFSADEPARHKVLDLVGDLFLYGGPPRGVVRAYRPGHWATHQAMRFALERGVIARL